MRIPTQADLCLLFASTGLIATLSACEPGNFTINNIIENNSSAEADAAATVEDDCCGDCCEDDCCEDDCCEDDCCEDDCCEDDCCEDDCDDTGDFDDSCECPAGYEPTPDGESCVMTTVTPAEFQGKFFDVCEGDDSIVYGKFGALYPGGTVAQSDYWGDDDTQEDGRLNEIGVWACDSTTGTAGTDPVGEWIGFSACIELDAPGDYLVGVAADNEVQFTVDGALFFADTSGGTSSFNYWYINPISLSAGTHTIEMMGKNNGNIAAFGAEIAGPFPAGSLVSDADMIAADYENNIIWSTGDLQGDVFDLGEQSGYTCPDGYALSVCEVEPECVETDEVPCEGDDDTGGGGSGDDGGGGDDGGDDGGGDDGSSDGTGADGADPQG